jgi:hypothetical protein
LPMRRSLHRRLGKVGTGLPRPDETTWQEAAHRYLTGRGPLPKCVVWPRVARCVAERWLGLRRPGWYIDGIPVHEKERVEHIIDDFRARGPGPARPESPHTRAASRLPPRP